VNDGGCPLNNGASRLVVWLFVADLLLMAGSKCNNLIATVMRFKRKCESLSVWMLGRGRQFGCLLSSASATDTSLFVNLIVFLILSTF